jgi:hypothetical protein
VDISLNEEEGEDEEGEDEEGKRVEGFDQLNDKKRKLRENRKKNRSNRFS